MYMDVVKEQSTRSSEAVVEQVGVYLALHAVHMDYIMRVHVTGWYGPTADHPGGWCRCYKGDPVDVADAVRPCAPARGRKRSRQGDQVWVAATLVA